MLLSKAYYYAPDEHCHLETTALFNIPSKLTQPAISQSVKDLQSASIGQNIDIAFLEIDRTSTVKSWKYQPQIITSSLERVKSIFEQSNCYAVIQLSSRRYSPVHKTYKRIAELGADNETYKYTLEWLEQLRTVIISDQMWWCEPLVNLSIDSEIVFEWWYENKKLTVYIFGNTAEYIKVWGPDIDKEMEDGSATSLAELADLWKWLVS
ncbi:hypothetical protein GS682_11775 [Nostoc sp. B(2019)]|nr:hypothetical protein [Nostoc sp. B(2019)]